MSKFIDDKTIWIILNDNTDDVKDIIKTTLKISPFGPIGKKTYVVEFINSLDETKYIEISGDLYSEYFLKLNIE
jgi:hypothetical protein